MTAWMSAREEKNKKCQWIAQSNTKLARELTSNRRISRGSRRSGWRRNTSFAEHLLYSFPLH
jgi:hypothetical protein